MRTIGLTGGIATGKSTAARVLRELLGVPVIDADQVSREVSAPGSEGLAEIVAAFGEGVLTADGALDRSALGARVMADEDARRRLQAITHPRIRAAMLEQLMALAQAGHPAAAVEAALLVETGSYKLYDALWVVSCAADTQLARLMARQGIGEAEARRWIDSQLPLAEKEAVATHVIHNDGDLAGLEAAVRAAWGAFQS